MTTKKMNNYLFSLILLLFISGCSLAPGMYMTTQKKAQQEYVYIESLDRNIEIRNINDYLTAESRENYSIGIGDQLAITVWGLPDVFPITNIGPDQNLRRVDSEGNIYFPYVGLLKAQDKTSNELRNDLTQKLSIYFNDPQLDLSIARFNSKKIYVLGEVTNPGKMSITDFSLTLSDALGEMKGINTLSAKGKDVFIIRNSNSEPEIYRADLSSPSSFISAGNFYLKDKDIIYVNASSTTRWNRVIAQFFPFSSFLNSVDNLTED